MIQRLQARITALSVVSALGFATATLLWLGFTGVSGRFVGFLPLWLTGVSLGSALVRGVANQVTWSRAWLAAPAYFYALRPDRFGWLVVTVAAGAATDLLDGLAARRFGQQSAFGGALDPVVDGLFYGFAAAGLWLSGLFPLWLAVVVGLRYALPAAAGAVLLAFGGRPELRHTPAGQLATTVIAVTLGGAALLRAAGHHPWWLLDIAYAAIPLATLLAFGNLATARMRSRSAVRPAGEG